MNGMRKNSSSQTHGTAITAVRPVMPSLRSTRGDSHGGGGGTDFSKKRPTREHMG